MLFTSIPCHMPLDITAWNLLAFGALSCFWLSNSNGGVTWLLKKGSAHRLTGWLHTWRNIAVALECWSYTTPPACALQQWKHPLTLCVFIYKLCTLYSEVNGTKGDLDSILTHSNYYLVKHASTKWCCQDIAVLFQAWLITFAAIGES